MSSVLVSDLEILATEPQASASWWAAVARALDRLWDTVETEVVDDISPAGIYALALEDAPWLFPRTQQASRRGAGLLKDIRDTRSKVTRLAGEPGAELSVAPELLRLETRARQYRSSSGDVLWESLNRDLGVG